MKPLLIVKCGGTLPPIASEHGDFEDWFAAGLGLPVHTVEVNRGDAPWRVSGLSGVLVTGSHAMVSHREDWSETTAAWLRDAISAGLPVLGVCYGHQLIAHALGGAVGPNPRGRQIGTRSCRRLTGGEQDPLLKSLPRSFPVQTSHREAVLALPQGAVRLAETELDPNGAVRFAPRAWGLQFHPEFGAPVMREYIRLNATELSEEGLDPETLLSAVQPTPESASVLSVFGGCVESFALESALASG